MCCSGYVKWRKWDIFAPFPTGHSTSIQNFPVESNILLAKGMGRGGEKKEGIKAASAKKGN